MYCTYLSNKMELPVIKARVLAIRIEILELAFILATIIDKEIAKIKASFLTNQDICLHNAFFHYSYDT